ncbi:MAG: mechanosensitive ion channel family protein [Thermodesulfobacteriota bacterium]
MDRIRELIEAGLGKVLQLISGVLGGWQPEALFWRILLTVIATGAMFLFIMGAHRLLGRLDAKLESWRGTRIPPIRVQTFEVVSADRLTHILKWLVKKFRLVVWVFALYVFIPVILSFFPQTQGLVIEYLDYLIAPIFTLFWGLVSFIPNLIFIAVVVVVIRYLLKILRVLFSEIKLGRISFSGFHRDWADPTFKLLRVLIILLAVVLVSPYMPGFGSPAFQGISIFFGLLLSLGSTAAIANIVAGVAITYMRPFNVGDRVRIADTMGDVVEKTLLITRVRTIKNVEVTIPNSMVLGSHMINLSALAKHPGLILHTAVTIGYDAPWRKVRDLLITAARATRDILTDPAPFVLQTSLNDFSVTYELNAYTANVKELLLIQSELHENIQDRFNEAGVEIMSPTYSALRDGNQVTIPEDYLPKSTPVKGFRILPSGIFGAGDQETPVVSGKHPA